MSYIVNVKPNFKTLLALIVGISCIFLCNSTFAANELTPSVKFMNVVHFIIGQNGENLWLPLLMATMVGAWLFISTRDLLKKRWQY
jgi:hypothetical protein